MDVACVDGMGLFTWGSVSVSGCWDGSGFGCLWAVQGMSAGDRVG